MSAAAGAEAEVTKLNSCTASSCFEAAEPETVYLQDVLEALFSQKLMKAEGALRSRSAKDFWKAHADSQALFPNNLL